MKKTKQRSTFWIYGCHAVVAALQNENREKTELRMTQDVFIDKSLTKNLIVRVVTKGEIESLLPSGAVHQGLALSVKPLAPVFIEDVLHTQKEKSVILILDQVTDPHNIGAILRSCAAFNATAILVQDAHAPEETGTLAKSACGALEIIPLVRVTNLVRALTSLKEEGYWILGLDGQAKTAINSTKLPLKTAFILGSEGEGMRRLTMQNCDNLIKLPISGKMESLNVSNAAAIALYEFNRT